MFKGRERRRSVWGCLWTASAALIVVGVLYVVVAVGYGFYVHEALLGQQQLPNVAGRAPPGSIRVADAHPEVGAISDASPPMPLHGMGSASPVEAQRHDTSVVPAQPLLPSWEALYRHPSDGDGAAPRAELYGNRRAVIPLLLTSVKYHGTSLLATTIQGWILKFLIPQGNIDLIIFYDASKVALSELLSILKLKKREAVGGSSSHVPREQLVGVELSNEDAELLGDGYFLTSFHSTYAFRVHPVVLPFPEYLLASNMTLLDDPSWMRCGCPPVCPQKRATVDYVQGTRWYTYDLFLQPIVQPYSFWIKLDVDIWMMRELAFNMVEALIDRGAVFGHTGYVYNGNGCSNELQTAIDRYLTMHGMRAVSADERWWRQDDNVYYSNFVISSMAFHLSPAHMRLAKALSEYPTGFFKYRWTDQSLFHKVFGVFFGPKESMFLLDWSNLRCSKKAYRKGAVFYHSKGKKRSSVLRLCTDI